MNKENANMIMRSASGLLVALALAVSLPARAASISLEPSQGTVLEMQDFIVSLMINATDAPGAHPGGLYGGGVVIDFDPALLSYNSGSLALQNGATFLSALVVGSAGGKQTLTFAFENAPETGAVATMSFKAIGPAPGTAALGIADYDDFFGSFISYKPSDQPFYPDFVGTSVELAAIPLPGAAWFMLTAVAAVAGRARRSIKAGHPA